MNADPEELAPADLAPADLPGGSETHVDPRCPECGSRDVRPSRSLYPRDRERNPDGASGFWRCLNCGCRYLGPPTPPRIHRSSRPDNDPLRRGINAKRGRRRWLPGLLIILATVLVMMLILFKKEGGSDRFAPEENTPSAGG